MTMNAPKVLLLAGLVSLAGAIAHPAPSYADEIACRGTLGAVRVDNLRVPNGATCILNGTRVQGNIRVGSRAILTATRVSVNGNIQAENAARVVVSAQSVVVGNIQIKQSQAAIINNTRIGGDLQFEENTRPLHAERNTIGGNLQAFKNRGGLRVLSNRIDGNLQCKENCPAPTGRGNFVQGNKEDQCARF